VENFSTTCEPVGLSGAFLLKEDSLGDLLTKYWVQRFLQLGRCKSVSLHTVEGSSLQSTSVCILATEEYSTLSVLSQRKIMPFADHITWDKWKRLQFSQAKCSQNLTQC
jgi:hypothetical protein